MADMHLRYDRMVEDALRTVVRDALRQAAESGLPGNHHFYISFRTRHPQVRVPGYLKAQYPEEMTIVLQYQYFGLEVDETFFRVTLSFNNKHEQLFIPFSALTTFADPSVNFALQFQPTSDEELEGTAEDGDASPDAERLAGPARLPADSTFEQRPLAPAEAGEGDGTDAEVATEPQTETDENGNEKVVTLDRFRKK